MVGVMKIHFFTYNMYMSGSLAIRDALESVVDEFPAVKVFKPSYPLKRLNIFYRLFLDQFLGLYFSITGPLVLFGNVPCICSIRRQAVFFHNVNYLLDIKSAQGFRQLFELIYFKISLSLISFLRKDVVWLFQTSHVERLFLQRYPYQKGVVIGSPFKNIKKPIHPRSVDAQYLFYPANLVTYKNHDFLTTVSPMLCKRFGLSVVTTTEGVEGVENIGYRSSEEIYGYISNSIALVFPSRTESLGVPLLEASVLGVPIIAPSLDYVNSVIDNYYEYKEDDINSFEKVVAELMSDVSKKTVRTARVKVEINPSIFISNICQVLR